MAEESQAPRGELMLRTLAMPADTNPAGDIFGGWLMSQMDIAGSMMAVPRAGGRVATVAVDAMVFHKPVKVGNILCCYADLTRVGRTSMRVHVQAWALDGEARDRRVKVTEGDFTYVAIGPDRKPRPVDQPQ